MRKSRPPKPGLESRQWPVLTWTGKQAPLAPDPARLVTIATYAAPDNCADPSSFHDNLMVEGDNLPALIALTADISGQVTCAYLDPPYNTGSDFDHYQDDRDHSAWLSFMQARIKVLHALLAENGSLWINIDDDECHYLKILCDEIFGRSNFVANVIWQKKYTIANDTSWFSDTHDHILVYAKNKSIWRPYKLARSETMNARYSNPDNHPKGVWKATPLHAKSGSLKLKNFSYLFRNGLVWSPPPGTYPRFSAETLQRLEAGNEIWFGRNGRGKPARKTFLSDITESGTPPLTLWQHEEVGHNHEARTEAKALNPNDVFATPKPERLIARIIDLATRPGDLVLDAFAGSGTTGAVAHKMRRRWIMIENGRQLGTHCLPRLQKVIDGADQGGVTNLAGWAGGGGFRLCRAGALAPAPRSD